MLRRQIRINLPPEHSIMSYETIEIKMAAVSAKRSMKRLSVNNVKNNREEPLPLFLNLFIVAFLGVVKGSFVTGGHSFSFILV